MSVITKEMTCAALEWSRQCEIESKIVRIQCDHSRSTVVVMMLLHNKIEINEIYTIARRENIGRILRNRGINPNTPLSAFYDLDPLESLPTSALQSVYDQSWHHLPATTPRRAEIRQVLLNRGVTCP